MEAIVLAGGLGTRLQGVIGEHPKCMANVAGQPFLAHLFEYLDRQGCTRAILSLGFKHWEVTNWLEDQDVQFEVDCVIESEPLGTGGGIQAALEIADTDDVAVVNGDTMFMVNLRAQMKYHKENQAHTTLALKEMRQFDRYGAVNTDAAGIITSFEEKQYKDVGLINGGIYIINKEAFFQKNLPEKFSFEKDYLEKYLAERKLSGYVSVGYFIDIGIPADYERAQPEFKTLFL